MLTYKMQKKKKKFGRNLIFFFFFVLLLLICLTLPRANSRNKKNEIKSEF